MRDGYPIEPIVRMLKYKKLKFNNNCNYNSNSNANSSTINSSFEATMRKIKSIQIEIRSNLDSSTSYVTYILLQYNN